MNVTKAPARPRETYRHGDLRRALVEAGLSLARAGGPEAVVLREVTRRAGVVPNAAYRHFKDRGELLEAVRSAALAAVAAAMERAMVMEIASLGAVSRTGVRSGKVETGFPSDRTTNRNAPSRADLGRARLRAVGIGYLRFAREETGLFVTAFTAARHVGEREPDPERAGPGGLNPFELLSAALEDMEAGGALAPARRKGAEYLAWSSVHGMAMLAIDGPLARLTAAEYSALGERLVAMVERGLT